VTDPLERSFGTSDCEGTKEKTTGRRRDHVADSHFQPGLKMVKTVATVGTNDHGSGRFVGRALTGPGTGDRNIYTIRFVLLQER